LIDIDLNKVKPSDGAIKDTSVAGQAKYYPDSDDDVSLFITT